MTQQERKSVQQFDKLSADTPVLASLASVMDVELVVSEDGKVMVIASQKPEQNYWWAEYDVDLKQLYFVTVEAKIQGLGMPVHEVFEKNMIESKAIRLVQFNQKIQQIDGLPYVLPLVVRKNTLGDPAND